MEYRIFLQPLFCLLNNFCFFFQFQVAVQNHRAKKNEIGIQHVAAAVVDTTAVVEAGKYPSCDGQIELGKVIVQQLKEMGVADVTQDEHGIVMGTVPGNTEAPVVAFNAHFDTSPETTGKNVKPNVIENFDGADITFSGDPTKVITAATCKELPDAKGKTIITTDGTTLLGGDDKCGVAIMMELANHLIENPDIKRGDVRLLFTCDEEIGMGVSHVDVDSIKAAACYTFDGGSEDIVDLETFSADGATVTFTGVNIHPAIAKDKMINAIRAAGHFLAGMPAELSPERTEGREGFLHPYVLEGGVAKATIKILLRDFDASKFDEYKRSWTTTAIELSPKSMASRSISNTKSSIETWPKDWARNREQCSMRLRLMSDWAARRNNKSSAAEQMVRA